MSEPAALRFLTRSAILMCAGSVLLLAGPRAGAQGNLGFLKDTPLAYFSAEDVKLMRAATTEVLKSTQAGTRKDWENPATGNGGAITLVTPFTAADGRQCNQVRVDTHAKTMENSSTVSVCKTPAGAWKADAAKPPKS
jgi:surface antigen